MQYKHVFFDLDHTLWDYETNSRESLDELFIKFQLKKLGVTSEDAFYGRFKVVNQKLWDLYDDGLIDREHLKNARFPEVFAGFGLKDEDLSKNVSVAYLELCPTKSALLPHAREVLNYLKDKYTLGIITNGFSEVQYTKLKGADIDHYFKTVTTSDSAGFRKPRKEIFEVAAASIGKHVSETIMIGDNLNADIQGALGSSMGAIFYNPSGISHDAEVTHEIACLSQLMNIF